MQKVLQGPGIRIELDTSEVIPDDPGAGTPALVHVGKRTSTFWWAIQTGEVDGLPLNETQYRWLENQEQAVDTFLFGD